MREDLDDLSDEFSVDRRYNDSTITGYFVIYISLFSVDRRYNDSTMLVIFDATRSVFSVDRRYNDSTIYRRRYRSGLCFRLTADTMTVQSLTVKIANRKGKRRNVFSKKNDRSGRFFLLESFSKKARVDRVAFRGTSYFVLHTFLSCQIAYL